MTLKKFDNSNIGKNENRFNYQLLNQIIRKRSTLAIYAALILLVTSLVIGLFIMPQSFTSMVSISLQSNSTTSSSLMLLGGGGAPKKYIGVIKSRRFVEEVDQGVGFKELLGFPDTPRGQEDAIDRVMKDLRVEDSATDGLLYITINLNGPPKFSKDPENRRKRLPGAVAFAANLYADSLRRYLKNTDTDKELSLLRSAEAQVQNARANYVKQINVLGEFMKTHRTSSYYHTSPSGGAVSSATEGGVLLSGAGGQSPEMNPSQTELQSLYLRRNALQQQINSIETVINKTRSLLNNPQAEVIDIPAEDPLLAQARRQVNEALLKLQNLQIKFGDSKVEVREAKAQLQLAQNRMHFQVESILNGKTSDHLKEAALLAEYQTVLSQITISEKNVYLGKNMAFELTKQQNDVTLNLEVLRTKLARYAELQVQTVSAQNRMAIIDVARPPRDSKPGLGTTILSCIMIVIFALFIWFAIEYILAMAHEQEDIDSAPDVPTLN